MNEDNKYLIPKRTVLPLEQINNSFFVYPIPNDEIKSVSRLLLDAIPSRIGFVGGLFEKLYRDELTKRISLIFNLISAVYKLDIPEVLVELISEYSIEGDGSDGMFFLEKWAKLSWDWNFKFPENKAFLNFPFENEKLWRLTQKLVEEKQYTNRSAVRQIILPQILYYMMPKRLIDLVDGYLGEDEKMNGKRYIKEIRKFLNTFDSMFPSVMRRFCELFPSYGLLQLADEALSSIEQNSGFKPFFTENPPDILVNTNFRKNSFECLASIIFERVWEFKCEVNPKINFKTTFFQFIMNLLLLHYVNSRSVKKISRFFYMVKSLVDSSRILSGNLPLNVAYQLTTDMVWSLYIHVYHRLELESPLMSLIITKNNKLASLTRMLNLLKEDVKDIRLNGSNDFSVIPANLGTGIRLFNYDKRSIPLDILYGYINESKRNFNPQNWFRHPQINDNDAKALAIRLLNIPTSGVKEYLLIDEIEKSLSSNKIRDPKYKKVLEQVRDALIKDSQFKPSENNP